MIEQLIKKYINKHLSLLESTVLSEAEKGWELIIPSGESIRGQRADDKAVAAGAFTGMPIIAKKTRKGKYKESDLEARVKANFEDIVKTEFPTKYDPKTTLYVYFQVLNKPNKKIWNVWGIDKKETGINASAEEIKKTLRDTKYYVATELKIDKIQAVTFLSYDQATKWFSYLNDKHKELKLSSKLELPKIDAIKTNVIDDNDQNVTTQDVTIKVFSAYDKNGKELYSDLDTSGFIEGTAKLSISPDGESVIIQPIEGLQTIRELSTDRPGTFKGVFDENGLPFKGLVSYDQATEWQIKTFDGELKSELKQRPKDQDFRFEWVKGRGIYGNGFVFDGEFKNKVPFNGDFFNKEGKQVGYYENGKYKSGISYPKDLEIDIDGTKIKFTVYELNNKLYVHDTVGKYWGQVLDRDQFEKQDLYLQDKTILDNTKSVDAATTKKLNDKFLPNNVNNLPAEDDTKETPPAPPPTPSKKKYVVFKSNTANIYTYNGTEFELDTRNSPTNEKDRSTGYPYLGVKTAKIKNGDGRSYKMYKIKVLIDRVYVEYYIPESYVKIVER